MNEISAQQKKAIKVPDLPRELYQNQLKYIEYNTSNIPPFFCTTESLVTEKYNSNPYLLRSTYYILPTSEYNLNTCGIPFAISIEPFCDRGSYQDVKALEMCKHCRSYLNCYTTVEDGSYICNICTKKSTGLGSSAECLKYSSIESIVPNKPFMNTKVRPTFVFIIDQNSPLVNDALYDSILDICSDSNFQLLYENVTIISFKDGMSLFVKNKELKRIKIMKDVPKISPNIIINSSDIESIRSIVELLRSESINGHHSSNALEIEPIQTIISVIKDISAWASGAKVALFSSFPSFEINYEEFLSEVKNVSINLFTTTKDKTLSSLAFYTSGRVFSYGGIKNYNVSTDLSAIAILRSAFDLSIVLKVSDNLTKTGVIAQSLEENLSVTRLSSMDSSSSSLFTLGLSGMSKNLKYVQFQISFTDYDGLRKIRILNHSFSTGTPQQFYSCMSFDSIFYSLCKLSVSENSNMEDILVNALSFYRNKISSSVSSSQFVLPETLKSLPVLVQAYSKKHNRDKAQIIEFNVEKCLRYFYPRLFSLSEYSGLAKTPTLSLTLNSLLNNEIYILENSQSIYVYVPDQVDQYLVSKLFDQFGNFIESEDEENQLLKGIFDEIALHYNYKLDINVIFAGKSPNEADFLSYMVEDAINNCSDYVDFIFKLHFKVQKS